MATATALTPPLVFDMDVFEHVVIRFKRSLTDDEFFEFCQKHDLLRIERNAEGELIIMPPVGGEGGFAEFQVAHKLGNWAESHPGGFALGPDTGIKFPDGSTFAPDAFWITTEQWQAVPRSQRQKFLPLVPPFVIEVRSRTDRKKDLHEKMLTYLRNGVELGWLIDPLSRTVRIYRQGQEFVELDDPPRVEGEGPVAGFVLDLKQIYDKLDL